MSFLDRVLLLDIFAGLRVTARHGGRKADTVEYPEQSKEPSERFRGMFRLDEERCIKCTLCAIECPINIIYIDWHSEKTPEGKSEKKLDRFDVDMKRCMFCGLCEEACPEEAIVMSRDAILWGETRAELIHDKETLYALGGVRQDPVKKWQHK